MVISHVVHAKTKNIFFLQQFQRFPMIVNLIYAEGFFRKNDSIFFDYWMETRLEYIVYRKYGSHSKIV